MGIVCASHLPGTWRITQSLRRKSWPLRQSFRMDAGKRAMMSGGYVTYRLVYHDSPILLKLGFILYQTLVLVISSVVIDLESISKWNAHASSSKSLTTLLLMLHQISIVIVPGLANHSCSIKKWRLQKTQISLKTTRLKRWL